MFKRRNQTLRFTYVLGDFIMTSLAFFVFNIIRYSIFFFPESLEDVAHYLLSTKLILEQIFVPGVLMLTYLLSGFYNVPFPKSRIQAFLVTAGSAAINTFLIFMTMLINDPTPQRRTEYFVCLILFGLLFLFVYSGRIIITNIAKQKARKSNLIFKTVIIGTSEKGRKAADNILSSESIYRNRISAFVEIEGEPRTHHKYRKIPILKQKDLKSFCLNEKVSQIVIAPLTKNDKTVLGLVDEFIDLNIPMRIAPDDFDYAIGGIHTDDILGSTLIDLSTPRIGECAKNLKRTFDLLFSLFWLILLSPFLLIIALAIKLDSKGSIFYTQERMGRHHLPFNIIKFRTMRQDAEKDGPQLSSDNDPRITKVGKYLRKYRLDELPQLINVVRGEMSIVGPRPEREFFINQIVRHVPYYSLVYQIRPGITSWAMVKFGYASSLEQMIDRTKFDMIYINNMSLMLDLKILFYTVRTIVSGAGK